MNLKKTFERYSKRNFTSKKMVERINYTLQGRLERISLNSLSRISMCLLGVHRIYLTSMDKFFSINYTSNRNINQSSNGREVSELNGNMQFELRWRSYSRLVSFRK
jgi:hypothetical protein